MLTMAWATLRIGEAAGLRRSDIDTVARTLRVANDIVEVGSKLHEGPPKTAGGRRSYESSPRLLWGLLASAPVGLNDGSTWTFSAAPREGRHDQLAAREAKVGQK